MMDTLIGKTLGNRYEILEKIGSGGMAVVYKARCTLLNRYVAVKVLRDEFTDNEEFIARFNIEAQAAASLSHQNIVSIYDVGTEADLHYIVMECVPGITLKDYINEHGALPWETALDYAIQIASGIEQAHKQNIIHRDIKPHNIIITDEGVLKVTDFGIARALNGNTITVNDSMGSVHYFSPEQARGGYTDEKSDIYSLGVVLYEMLTGHVPFEADSPVSVALMHIQEEPLPILVRNPEVPADLAEIAMKAMAKEQVGRYESASALIEALKSFEGVAIPGRKSDTTALIDGDTRARERDRTKNRTQKEKKPITKGDKIAVAAGIAVSFLLVGLMMLFIFLPMFGSEKVEATVPSLIGKDVIEVQEYYKDSEVFEIVVIRQIADSKADENVILSQEPKAEQKVSVVDGDRQRIELVVSSGAERLLTPKVVGSEVRQAEIVLINAKLVPTVIEEESEEPEGTVIRQYPLEGKEIKTGEEVVLYVSSGPEEKEKIKIPNVVGKTVNEAKNSLKDFTDITVVYEFSDKTENCVILQSPDAGTEGDEDTEIVLTVSKGKNPSGDTPKPPVTPDNGGSSGENDVPVVAQKSKNVVIKLPADLSEVNVQVKANGKSIYNQKVETSLGRISVPVTGTGVVAVEIFFDGESVGEQTVSFDE